MNNIISVSCNECGTNTNLPASTKFYTCSNCKTALKIMQSGNTYYTKRNGMAPLQSTMQGVVPEKAPEPPKVKEKKKKKYDFSMKPSGGDPSSNLKALEQIDDDWRFFKSRSKFLGMQITSSTQSTSYVFCVVFSIVFVFGLKQGITMFIAIVGLILSIYCSTVAGTHDATRAEYQRRRDVIWKRMGSPKEHQQIYY